jgi:hypothetical protein
MLDDHLRKEMKLQEIEKWFGPWINYDPAKSSSSIAWACVFRIDSK